MQKREKAAGAGQREDAVAQSSGEAALPALTSRSITRRSRLLAELRGEAARLATRRPRVT